MTRRGFLACGLAAASGLRAGRSSRRLELLLAPSNLGLRPPAAGVEPGAWQAPEALLAAGLAARLSPAREKSLPRPAYRFEAEPGTRIRNGHAIRDFSESLAAEVESSLRAGAFPLVVGGDCSVMLGCLLGARRSGTSGLAHVDGHSDFFHPGNYDTTTRLGSAAGMDLALATGRGEDLLTRWPGVTGPLAADADTIQLGERDSADPGFAKTYGDIVRTGITRVTVQEVLRSGIAAGADRVIARLALRGLDRVWVHVDLDVLDLASLPAVDSPGTPGFSYAQLSALLRALLRSGRIAGVDIAIYDPSLDPTRRYARKIVACMADVFRPGGI